MKYAEFQEIRTSRLVLRALTMEDAPGYFSRLFGSAAVAKHMLWEPHQDVEQSRAAIEKVLERYRRGRYYRWGITRKEDDGLIGIIELLRFDEETGECSFAYMLGEAFWGLGFGTEALKAAFDFAFGQMEVSAIKADHFAENGASGAVMRKAGMVCTGVIPGKYEKQGKKLDAAVYRITKEQWQEKTRC